MSPRVALLDYGSGNLHSAHRALARVGAEVIVTSDPHEAEAQDRLVIPGVGAFAECMAGLKVVRGDRLLGQFLAGSRPVLGICVGHQILFEAGEEHGIRTTGCGEYPGVVERLHSDVLPHMGWNTVEPAEHSDMFAGVDGEERFYFVHSYAVRRWEWVSDGILPQPQVTWSTHGGDRFIAAVESGNLWSTQFHPEKSGDAGAALLERWLAWG